MKKILYHLLFIVILAGCSGDGIFYTLENEEKVENANNLADNIPLFGMLVYDDQYVVNGKRIWHSTRDTDTTSWSKYPLPSGYDGDSTFPSIALLAGELYATVISIDGGYKSGVLHYNSTSDSWEEVVSNNGDSDDYKNYYLFYTDTGLYINEVSYSENSDSEIEITDSLLYYCATGSIGLLNSSGLGGTTLITVPGDISTTPSRIIDIAYDSSNTNTYLIYNLEGDGNNDGVICVAPDEVTFSEVTTTDYDGLYDYTSLFYYSPDDILLVGTLSDDNDYNPVLFYNQTDWYAKDYSDTVARAFCDISAIQSDTILAGTRAFVDSSSYDGDGYFEIDMSDPADPSTQENSFSDDNNYDSSDLESTTIRDFYYDTLYDRLYAVTTSGLWLNTSDGSEREWALE